VLDQESGKAKVFIRIMPEIKLYQNAAVAKKAASLLGEYYMRSIRVRRLLCATTSRVALPELHEGDEIKTVTEPVRWARS